MGGHIHSTAIVNEKASLAPDVEVGPYCVIGAGVELGPGSKLLSHVVMEGALKVGGGNVFYPFTSVGAPPQDFSYKGEATAVEIGEGNIFREGVSIHRGTTKESRTTRVGDHNFLMAYVHLGHDVSLGSHCVMANSVNLAGHVKVADRVIMGGGVQVSQFVSFGQGSYIGGATAIDRDIPPFCTAVGNRVKLRGINIIGLRRAKYDRSVIAEIVDFYRAMEASALSPRAFVNHEEFMQDFRENTVIAEMVTFIRGSEVGIAPFT